MNQSVMRAADSDGKSLESIKNMLDRAQPEIIDFAIECDRNITKTRISETL